jgi:hypothetical protein
MDCIGINEAISNKLNICFSLDSENHWKSKNGCFQIIDFIEINKDEIDNLEVFSIKTPIEMGKLLMLRLKIIESKKNDT